MTYLAASISGDTIEDALEQIRIALEAGADMIELRLDMMPPVGEADMRVFRAAVGADLPIILTMRGTAEGGCYDGDDDERVSKLIELGPYADYIDVELALWRRSANVRRKIELALTRLGQLRNGSGGETNTAGKRQLILSRHDVSGRPAALHAEWLEMLSEPACAAAKMAWRARTIRDNFEAFELLRTSPRPAVVICLGADGLPSRVLAGKFGAFAAMAAPSPGRATAPGQVPVSDLRNLYRWDAIDSNTAVYGVIGDPVGHSIGPRVHNTAFARIGAAAVYLPMRVGPGYEAFKAFMVEIQHRPWLDVRGLSVTLPHKENALRFVREAGGRVDEAAAKIGAVNTIGFGRDGAIWASNTDSDAAIESLCAGARLSPEKLAGMEVAVLGAGGSARAVVAGLVRAGAGVTIYNRTAERAAALAGEFGCRSQAWECRKQCTARVIVNCTSVGMAGAGDDSPMPADALRAGQLVFDLVYRARETTRLLRDASERGCRTVGGIEMFAAQARAQFAAWTGHDLPLEFFREQAQAALSAAEPPGR